MNTPNSATEMHALEGADHALVVFTEPGMYALNEDLNGVRGKAAIRIDADNVVIDLCGFSVQGCEGSLDGIPVTTIAANIVVKNGDINGWGQDGLDLSNAVCTKVSHLRLFDNGGLGLLMGAGRKNERCSLDRNRGYGGASWSRGLVTRFLSPGTEVSKPKNVGTRSTEVSKPTSVARCVARDEV